ncbi:MAG: Fic family protein [Lachnospiraceae bacterium]|nr:Fic family protein [Lachnospiraceae bacterium]
MIDPYVYSGTNILKNVLGIQDRQILDNAEADYVSLRLRELAENPLRGDYSINHLAKMHKYIFQDLYEWAGNLRTINIEKEEPALGGLSVEYSDKTKIEEDLFRALEKMTSRSWASLSLDDKVKHFSEDLAAVWKVHGFREGNTRLVVTFCCQFIEEQGIPIDRTIFEKHSAYVRTALVAYCAVFHDLGDLSKKEYLERIIRDSLGGAMGIR